MKKIPLIMIFLFFISLSLRAQDTTLNFWQFSVKPEVMNELINKFEAKNPQIKIKMQQLTWDYGLDKIIISLAADNAPDIFELGSTWIPRFSTTDTLLDITDEVRGLTEHYLMWEPVSFEGRIYGFPWLLGTRIIFYNCDLFKQAGLDPEKPPHTWLELLLYAKKIKNLRQGIFGYGLPVAEPYSPWQAFMPFAWGKGGQILNDDFSRSLFNSSANLEALNFYLKLKPYSLVDRKEQIDQLFTAGRVGMMLSGAWNFELIAKNNPRLNFNVALVPRPDEGGESTSFAGGEFLVINKKTLHSLAALKFLKFLVAEENEMLIVREQKNVLPSNKKAIFDPFYKNHPRLKISFEQLKTAIAPPAYPRWEEVQEYLTQTIEKVILENVSPQTALALADQGISKILKEEIKKGEISDRRISLIIFSIILLIFLALLFWYRVLWYKKGDSVPKTTWLFLSPWLVLFLVFSLYPLVYSIILSFAKYNLLSARFSFIGLENYLALLKDKAFLEALWHTLFFAVGTIPFTLTIALLLAVLINEKLPLPGLFQSGFFLPAVTSIIVIATVFTYLYSPDGFLNFILEKMGISKPQPNWLVNTKLALPAIMAMAVWSSFGYYLILFLAGLQAIPKELYEAASIDGANWWQRFFKITLPNLRSIILLVVVINTNQSLQVFPEIFTMTRGGPQGATTTIVYHLYEKGFHQFEMGAASAIAYFLCLIIICFSLIQMRVLRER